MKKELNEENVMAIGVTHRLSRPKDLAESESSLSGSEDKLVTRTIQRNHKNRITKTHW